MIEKKDSLVEENKALEIELVRLNKNLKELVDKQSFDYINEFITR